jgi:hypothetical protein
MLCPISLSRVRARDLCEASFTLCGSLDFSNKYFQLKKLPAGVYSCVLVQGYKGLTKLPSRRVILAPEEE